MRFYKLQNTDSCERVLRPFIKPIDRFSANGEFQYFSHDALIWKIEAESPFSFKDFYYINCHVPVFSRQIWDAALSIVDMDGLFQIPLTIEHCGERHDYWIVIPSRIHCLDCKGRIMSNNVGRYHLFRSERLDDNTLYVSEDLKMIWKTFSTLNIN